MLVKCRCGQEFSTYDTRFPHRVSCHMCGVKFMVLEDGTTDELRAISVNVHCRCGRLYVINALQFPRGIHCIDCNHRFSVLDTGEIIDSELELASFGSLDTSAIQVKSPNERTAVPVTSIQEARTKQIKTDRTEDSKPFMPASPIADPHEERLRRQLSSLDTQWSEQRRRYAACLFGWYRFYPTKKLFLLLYATVLNFSAIVSVLPFAVAGASLLAGGLVFLVMQSLFTLSLLSIFQKAALLHAGEQRWQTERETLIALHEAKQDYRAEERPIDLDESAC
jgi:DNA-directed RNA polymerase subunit RPC12/RpoP